MRLEEKILLEENEIKPNLYVANTVLFSILFILFAEVLNHFGIFHVKVESLHFCTAVVIVCSGLLQIGARIRSISSQGRTKYLIIAIVLCEVLALSLVLPQWTELLLALPILLAIQYHKQSVTKLALWSAIFIAAIGAPLAVLLDTAQLDFYLFLVRSTGHIAAVVEPIANYNVREYMWLAFVYLSVPRCFLIGALSPVCVYITRLASANIDNRVTATYYSSVDAMTGLYNRFRFEEQAAEFAETMPMGLICIYADANGLHELNDEKGHAAGDELLKFCATSLQSVFGEYTYRIGGDEFLCFVLDKTLGEVEIRLKNIELDLKERDYHMSVGVAELEDGMTITELIKKAEFGMYDDKREYYEQEGKDRRRHHIF